ncbi:MAG: class I SAM-dependent methyltransferase [Gemmatimonadetes bacterium]|nr:class I SAM-dependent methyltransferase [Gemmatimonadota bacterium]
MRARAPRDHWNKVWDRSDPDRVSWFEPRSETSGQMIESSELGHEAGIIDVGGGASLLARRLLDAGYGDLTVLDISEAGLAAGRERLGPRAPSVEWIHADVRDFEPARTWDLWHDRAVFHFLTVAEDRAAYLGTLGRALAAGGQVILATFGPDGPDRCSGLEVRRYSAEMLVAEFDPGFRLEESSIEAHATPAGVTQQFLYARLRRSG